MRIIKSKNLNSEQKQEIFKLWNKEYPVNLEYNDISEFEDYLSKLKDQNHLLLIDENDRVKGWYFDFLRDNERWFVAILDSNTQGMKFGTKLMELAKRDNEELNGWVIHSSTYIKANGEAYLSPIEFYKKHGFNVLDKIELKNDQINAIKIKWSKDWTKYNSFF